AQHEQVRVVERGAIRVHQRVAELPALVNRAGYLGGHVTGNAAREGELPEQLRHAGPISTHRRVALAIRALQPGVCDDRGAAVSRTGYEDRVQVAGNDRAVHVRVEQVEPRTRAPMAEQPRLDVLRPQRLAQQWIVQQVDLPDGQV